MITNVGIVFYLFPSLTYTYFPQLLVSFTTILYFFVAVALNWLDGKALTKSEIDV